VFHRSLDIQSSVASSYYEYRLNRAEELCFSCMGLKYETVCHEPYATTVCVTKRFKWKRRTCLFAQWWTSSDAAV